MNGPRNEIREKPDEIDEDAFVEAMVAFPVVQQNAMRDSIRRGLDDYWVFVDGPVGQVRRAFTARLISGPTYDRVIIAMGNAGHSAYRPMQTENRIPRPAIDSRRAGHGTQVVGSLYVVGMKRRRDRSAISPELREIFDAADAMTNSGQEPRKHHLVPRFYLNRWAENDRIRVTDLDAHKSHVVDPKNALIETDFYRVPRGTTVGSDSPVVREAWLSKIEGDAALSFAQFDRGGIGSLSGDELEALGAFISVQTTRSRYHRMQMKWNAGVGLHRAFELDKPGAIAAQLRRAGEEATAERVAEIEAYVQRLEADPWQFQIPPGLDMDLAQRSAVGFNDHLSTRKMLVFETERPLLTGDEPVVGMWEHMGVEHPHDGGWHGAPIIAFPMDPHHVLAFFRQNMPLPLRAVSRLTWFETLELNRTIAGNSYRHTVAQPSNGIAEKLFIPESKEPMEMKHIPGRDGDEFIRWRPLRRWSDEAAAPVRPVTSWWPALVPPAPSLPRTQKDWAAERARWESY